MPNNPFPSDCGGKCSQSTRRSWYSETQTFFLLQALNELLEDDDRFGFVIMDGNGSLFGTLCGNTRTILHKFSVDLPKKHGRGGQSALRFVRLRLEKRRNYMYVMFLGAPDKQASFASRLCLAEGAVVTCFCRRDTPRLNAKYMFQSIDVSHAQ